MYPTLPFGYIVYSFDSVYVFNGSVLDTFFGILYRVMYPIPPKIKQSCLRKEAGEPSPASLHINKKTGQLELIA
jgi:hypothetical protein